MSTSATIKDAKNKPGPDHTGSLGGKDVADDSSHNRRTVFNRQKDEYGGVKVGLAFFGWLTATGTAVMLTAFVAAAGTAVSVVTNTDAGRATSQDPKTVGIVGALVLLVVLFVAYYCGGYVAGRMARFHGVRQGLAVWLWAVAIAALVAVLAALAGSQYDVLSKLNSFPRIPVSQGNLTTGGLVALVVVAAGSLCGALAGGLAGMHFHRKVDKAGLAG
jgi:MFS family permease